MYGSNQCIFVWYFAGKLGERSRREKIPASKMRKGLLFAKRSWKDGETEGVQIFFVNYFSPAAKWCGPEGNSYSALSWGWNLWVFFLERKTKFEWEKKNSKISSEGQSRVWISWGTTSFCQRRKIIDKKNLHSRSCPILPWSRGE